METAQISSLEIGGRAEEGEGKKNGRIEGRSTRMERGAGIERDTGVEDGAGVKKCAGVMSQ